MPDETPTRSAEPTIYGPLSWIRAMGPNAGLFALLCLATFFEGFDTKLASFVQPVIAEDFGASVEAVGAAVGLSSFGMVVAFFITLLADTIGRRPVFLGGLAAYAIFTLATGFATSLVMFTVLQFFARMAMVVELFIGYLILSEEMPPEIRGRANGLFASTASLGAAVPAALLLPLDEAGIGWRGLFLIGAIPLLLFPIYLKRIHETRAYLERPTASRRYGEDFRRIAHALWNSEHRSRLMRLSAIWFAMNFWSGTALYFFTVYVFNERGWTAAELQLLPYGTIPAGLAGYILSGVVMDRLGRRSAATLYFAVAFAATAFCYRSTDDLNIYLGYFMLFGVGGVWTIVTTWTTELFPTEMRATALAIAHNLIGRMGLVLGPIAAGFLAGALSSTSSAILLLSVVTLLAVPLVWSLPETKGIALRGEEAGA